MQNSVVALRERIEELEEECRQLREMLVPALTFDPKLKLKHQEKQILAMLLKVSPKIISTEYIFTMVWGWNSESSTNIVSVHICKIRKKLRPFGIEIVNIWGEGFFIPSESAEKLRSYMVQAYA